MKSCGTRVGGAPPYPTKSLVYKLNGEVYKLVALL